MRYAIASDIHGSAYWCAKLLDGVEREKADRLILLGDLMYHGPRNPLPDGYDPISVATQLNELSNRIIAVRGNCDSEVDQMLLDFPCMQDYALILDGGTQLFCTHGHLALEKMIRRLPEGSIVLTGHTHIKENKLDRNVRHLNPGSVSMPKDGSHSFLIYENGTAEIVSL